MWKRQFWIVSASTHRPSASCTWRNFCLKLFDIKFLTKIFFRINQNKTALLSSSSKHNIEPKYIIEFSGLSSQGFAHECSQEFGFGAALKGKVQLITCWSLCFSWCEFLWTFTQKFKIMSDYLGSWEGFRSAWDNNLFQLHLHCLVQIFTWLRLGQSCSTCRVFFLITCWCMGWFHDVASNVYF